MTGVTKCKEGPGCVFFIMSKLYPWTRCTCCISGHLFVVNWRSFVWRAQMSAWFSWSDYSKSLYLKNCLYIDIYNKGHPHIWFIYWVEGDKVSSFFFEAFNNMLNSCFYFCLMNKVHNIFELCSLHCSHGKSITRMEQQSTERFWRSYWFLPIISREIHLGKKICLIMLFDNLACQCETRNSDIHHEVLWYSNF